MFSGGIEKLVAWNEFKATRDCSCLPDEWEVEINGGSGWKMGKKQIKGKFEISLENLCDFNQREILE